MLDAILWYASHPTYVVISGLVIGFSVWLGHGLALTKPVWMRILVGTSCLAVLCLLVVLLSQGVDALTFVSEGNASVNK